MISLQRVLILSLGGSLVACVASSPTPISPQTATPAREESRVASQPPPPVADEAAFEALAHRYVDEFSRFSPIDATRVGDHRHDAELDDVSESGRAAQLAWDQELLATLERIDRMRLSRASQVDSAMLGNSLRYDIWNLTTSQHWAWDPLLYNDLAGNAIYNLMAREFAPLPQRLKSATARLANLHRIYDQEHANLDPVRVPKIYAEQARDRNHGVASLIDEFIQSNVNALSGEEHDALVAALTAAKQAVADQQKWLESELVPKAQGNFRVGQAMFDAQLAFALHSKLDRKEIRRRAEAELQRVRAEMYGIAREALENQPKAPPMPESPTPEQQQAVIAAALARAGAEQPPREGVVEFAKQALQSATQFVRSHDLVTVPNDPVEIILMPEFQRGFSVAYCDSPGPLDVGQKTFFAISPIPKDWEDKKVKSFLREYNTRAIQDLTFHEAMPGHYLQLAASNRYPSKLRAVLGSGTFIEGWGVYAERVMTDSGYLSGDPLMRLVNRKWYLRAIANAILDQAIHVDGMTREQAMHLMTHDTFQEEREAAGKWQRAQLSATQLSTYFVGFQEHWDLRQEAQRRAGASFNLKAYHDQVLSYGSPPGRFVRALMLDLPIDP